MPAPRRWPWRPRAGCSGRRASSRRRPCPWPRSPSPRASPASAASTPPSAPCIAARPAPCAGGECHLTAVAVRCLSMWEDTMASIRREVMVEAAPEVVWDAIRDVGAVHKRLAPGFVVDTRLEEGARIVTFGNGVVARELIVDVDEVGRRLVWSVVGGRMTHHNASLQVFAESAGSRVVWIADLLPNEVAPYIAGMIDQGMAVMKKTMEARAAGS